MGDEFQALWIEKLKERPRLLADRSLATLRWHLEIPGDRVVRVYSAVRKTEIARLCGSSYRTAEENGFRRNRCAYTFVEEDDLPL